MNKEALARIKINKLLEDQKSVIEEVKVIADIEE